MLGQARAIEAIPLARADGTGADTVEADQPPPRPAADLEKAAALKEQALADTGVQGRLTNFGFQGRHSTPEELGAMLREDLARWAPIIKAAGIKPE